MIDIFLLRNALRDLARPKKLFAAMILILGPAAIVLLLRMFNAGGHFDSDGIYSVMGEKVVFGFVMVILSVVFCTSVVAQEVEDKTISYLLTRPVPRFRILIVKFIPALIVTLITVWIALLVTGICSYGVSGLHGSPVGRDMAIAPIGVVAYGTVFLLLSTIFNRPLIIGLIYTFGWETWVPYLPGSFQRLSLMSYLRVLAPHSSVGQDDVELSTAITAINQDSITNHMAWAVLITVSIVAFGVALYAFSTREYVSRDVE